MKAKLAAVTAGITTFEEEFLPHIVVGDGRQTVAQSVLKQIADTGGRGSVPRLLGEGHLG